MIRFTNQLLSEVEEQLAIEAIRHERAAVRARASFDIVNAAMVRLKDFMKEYVFADQQEEIRFFKEEKPKLHQLLIFYGEQTFIESNKPIRDRKSVIRYLSKVIEGNNNFIERHKLLHSYYHLGHYTEDHILFLRSSNHPLLYPEYRIDLDSSFSVESSLILSQLLAFEKLNEYYSRQIEQLKKGPEQVITSIADKKKYNLVWTATKASFVELVYGIYSSGAANFGKADINQLMQGMESVFNIQIDNPYRTYVDLSNRKKERTPFLDNMKFNLEKNMDDKL